MPADLTGTWKLLAWRRIAADGTVTHPIGDDAGGLLVYTANGRMIVQLVASGRPELDSSDPLGGDVEVRARLYSTCLAYFGTYELRDDTVLHRIEMSLYPGWSGDGQERYYSVEGDELTLRTPPMTGANAGTVNELAWRREAA